MTDRTRPPAAPASAPPTFSAGPDWLPIAAVCAAVVAAIVAYVPAFGNGFVWDDPIVLQQLRAFRSWSDLVVMPPIVPKFYYRPLVFVSYFVDRALGGEAPYWFHASVIATHAANTLLVALLARRLLGGDWFVPGCAALLFAVHPAHTESVAWMAGRSDVLVCTFLLLTVLLALRRDVAWSAWLAGAAYLAALLSKEMAVAVLLLVPLLDLLQTRRLFWTRYLPLLAATVVYFLLRHQSVGAFVGGTPASIAAGQAAADLVSAVGYYVIQVVVPVGLSAYVPVVPQGAIYFAVGIVAPLAAILAAWWFWQHRQWGLVFALVWFFSTLAPSLTVILRRSASAVVADRYLYVPSVAVCVLLAWTVAQLGQRTGRARQVTAIVVCVLALIFGARTQSYARIWYDNLSFWSDVAPKVPSDAMPQRELGIALMDHGRFADAERALRAAQQLPSDAEGQVMTYSNLGSLYRRQGRIDEARQALEAAIQIGPHPGLYHNLGMVLMTATEQAQKAGDQAAVLRNITAARQAFEHALSYENAPNVQVYRTQWNPAKSHALLGQILFSLGERAKAREELETSLRLEPTGPVADATRQYLQKFAGAR